MGIFKDHYEWIPGFADHRHVFETEKELPTFNAHAIMVGILDYIMRIAKYSRSNHILIPWGGDFKYQESIEEFRYMESIIDYTNKHNRLNIKFL